MRRTLLILICVVVLLSSVALVSAGGFKLPIPYHNSTLQIINDSNVYMGAYPEGINRDMYVYFWLQTKNFTGDIDAVWGFNPAVAEPTIGELRINHKAYWNTTDYETLINVSANSSTSADCQIGNDYNTYKRNVTYRQGDENYESYTTVSSVICFDNYSIIDENNSVEFGWHTKHSRTERWMDISEKFRVEYYNYSNTTKWYLLKNVTVQQGQMYRVRAFIELKANTTGKYIFAVKPSSMTIQQAIAAGYFYMLDPSWITWNKTGFDEGTYTNSSWNSTGEYVSLNFSNLTGNYTSKVFDAGGTASWDNITWTEGVPYQEELPNNQTIETVLGGANMTQNIFLFHFDNNSTYGENNTTFFDFSYSGNNGSCAGDTCPTFTTSGRFGAGAYEFDAINDDIDISNSDTTSINETITLSAWIKYADTPTIQKRIIYKQYGYVFRVYSPTVQCYPYASDGSYNGAYTTSSPIGSLPDEWTHVACTIDTTAPALERTKLYVNGILRDTEEADTSINVSTTSIIIGSGGTGHWFNGTIDEVAIWNKSLSATEILDLYKRGANKLNVTVRSCDDSACSGDAWNYTYDEYPQDLNVTDNQYFQYKVGFETDNENHTPELYNVTVNYTLLADTSVAPVVSITSPPNNTTTNNNTFDIWINVTDDDNATGLRCTGFLNDTNVSYNASVDNSTLTNLTITSAQADGQYWLTVNCTDNIQTGNSSNYSVEIDTVNPTITWVFPTPDNMTNTTNSSIYLNATTTDTHDTATIIDWNNTLIGYWSFENYNETHILDDSNYSHDAGMYSGLNIENITYGRYGKALEFDGADDWLRINNTADLNLSNSTGVTDVSYFGWFRSAYNLTDYGSNWTHYVIYKPQSTYLLGWAGWSHDGWECNVWNSGVGGERAAVWYTYPLVEGEWHYVGCVFENGTSLKLYIDGDLVAENNTIPKFTIQDSDFDLFIGAKHQFNELVWNGTLDEIKIWKRAISWGEVNASMNSSSYNAENNFTNLTNYTYNYTAYAIDEAGNMNITGYRWVYINNSKPNITIVTPSDYNKTITRNWYYVNVSLDEEGSGAMLEENGTNYTMTQGTTLFEWYLNRTGLSDGNYTWKVYANDTANNTGYTGTSWVSIGLYTSLEAVHFSPDSFNFSSSTYITGIQQQFNTSATSTNITFIGFFNIDKETGGGTNEVTVNISIDGNQESEEVVGSVDTTLNDISTGFQIFAVGLPNGQHNFTVEFKRSGNGIIEIHDIEMFATTFQTTSGGVVANNLTNATINHDSVGYTNIYNWSVNKGRASPTVILAKKLVNQSTAVVKTVDYFIEHLNNTSHSSPYSERTVSKSGLFGSIFTPFLDIENESGIQNYSIQGSVSATADITVNASLLSFDLVDTLSYYIKNFNKTNQSTNTLNNLSLSAGVNPIVTQSVTIHNGTSYTLIGSASFTTSSGDQTPELQINSSNSSVGNCTHLQHRNLKSSAVVGDANVIATCDNLSIGSTYEFNLMIAVEAGETVLLLDENFIGFETTPFDIVSTTFEVDADGDGFNSTVDCNDNDENIYPLINNTINYFVTNTTICTDTYNNSRVNINNSYVAVNFNDSTLIGFGAAGTAIEIPNKAYQSVGNATIYNYQQGIHADASDFTTIRNMEIHNITGYGIYLEGGGVNDAIVANNTIYNTSSAGIYVFDNSFRNRVENNTFHNNTGGSISVRIASHNTTIKGNLVYDNTGQVGIHFHTSDDGEIINNTVYTSVFGIELYQSSRTVIANNSLYNNTRGIYLQTVSRSNNITNNTIFNNTGVGINITSTSTGNQIWNNWFNNTPVMNAWSDESNTWNLSKTLTKNIIGGNYMGGNFWDDYNGSDTTGDGLGDTFLPYTSAGNISVGGDYAPLTVVNDTTPPFITIEPPSHYNESLNQSWFHVNISLNESGSGATLEVNGSNYSMSQGVNNTLWYVNVTVAAGNWTWKAYARDLAGNEAVTGDSWVFITIPEPTLPTTDKLLLEVYLVFSIMGILFFVGGIIAMDRLDWGLILLVLSLFCFIITTFYSFSLTLVGFGDSAVLTQDFNYFTLGVFWSFIVLLNIGIIIMYVVYKGAETVTEEVLGRGKSNLG